SDALHISLYGIAFTAGDTKAMDEQAAWLESKSDFENEGLGLESDTEAYSGRLLKALAFTKRASDSAVHNDNKEGGALWEEFAAVREAMFGSASEARQSASEGMKLAPTSRGVEIEAALALAIVGDTAGADALAQDMAKRFPLDTHMQSLWLPAIRAQLALDRR